jgi:hypothetical protein
MATMNRNVNLEEINSDAFMGITYLAHQTVMQKMIFIGSLVASVGFNLAASFVFHMNSMVGMFISLVPLMVGILFGCNYNEDLSLYNYIHLIVSKPSKLFLSMSTEDFEKLRSSGDRIRQEEIRRNANQKATEEEQKKMLIKLGVGFAVGVLIFVILMIAVVATRNSEGTEEVHHTVSALIWERDFYE